jgi:hypothetical protein
MRSEMEVTCDATPIKPAVSIRETTREAEGARGAAPNDAGSRGRRDHREAHRRAGADVVTRRAFMSDEESAALRDSALRLGCTELAITEMLIAAEDARRTIACLELVKLGEVVPIVVDGALGFDETDAVKAARAERLAAVHLGTPVQP